MSVVAIQSGFEVAAVLAAFVNLIFAPFDMGDNHTLTAIRRFLLGMLFISVAGYVVTWLKGTIL